MRNLKKKRIQVYFLIALCLLVYINSISNRFSYDDVEYIVQNPFVRSPQNIGRIFTHAYPPHKPELYLYRPLVELSYLFDWLKTRRPPEFRGLNFNDIKNTHWFHVSNILFHIITTLLVLSLFHNLLENRRASFIAALIFAVHPVHVEAVTSLVGRAESLSALFFLLGLYLFVRERKKGGVHFFKLRFIFSWFCFLLALLCKESAVTLPPMILITDWFIRVKNKKLSSESSISDAVSEKQEVTEPQDFKIFAFQAFLRILPYGGVFLLYIIIRLSVLGNIGIGPSGWYFGDIPFIVRMSAMLIGFLAYIRLLIFPGNMSGDYNFPVRVWGNFWAEMPESILAPWAIAGLLVFLLCVFWIFWAALRKKDVIYPLLFFFITMFPFSNIMPFGDFIAERFLYLPSAGFAALLGVGFSRVMSKRELKTAAVIVLCLLIAGYSIRTILRNRDWRTGLKLWNAEMTQNPKNPNLYTALGSEYAYQKQVELIKGNIYRERGEFQKAAEHLEKAMEYEKKALEYLEKAIKFDPRDYWSYYHYGGLAVTMRNPDMKRAEEYMRRGASLMPENFRSLHAFYYRLGVLMMQYDPPRVNEAVEFLRKAHRLKRSDKKIANAFALAYIEVGEYDKAADITKKVLEIHAGNSKAVENLRILRMIKTGEKSK